MEERTRTRVHCTRLMQAWRSAGWPCKDGIEIDLLAAQLLSMQTSPDGRATLKLTEGGIRMLADARQRALRAASPHDRLAQRFPELLMTSGRIGQRELPPRSRIDAQLPPSQAPSSPGETPLWDDGPPAELPAANVWRMARPDLFSVRNTTVKAYLYPMVHEVKFNRAAQLSDLRHEAKRLGCQWLCSGCHYVFPAAVARAHEIPEPLGVWVLYGDPVGGCFELLRPARHAACTLPSAVWLGLAKATPMRNENEAAQAQSGDEPNALP